MGAAVFALAAFVPVLASIVTTDIFIVREQDPITEDVYVASQSGQVEGMIDGDLVIFTGDLTISGVVTGDVIAVSSGVVRVTADGDVRGSVRATAREVVVDGAVGDDVAAAAIAVELGDDGSVGRDLIAFGATLDVAGSVGRDVRGRVANVTISGVVGNDVDMTVSRMGITAGAVVGGDVLYHSAGEASISEEATITGQTVRLASSPNFIYGIILTLANIVSLLAFIVLGFVLLWLFRHTSSAAVSAAWKRPVRSLLVGVVAVVAAPLLVVLFAATLVGLPLALALAALVVFALVAGPIPAVAAGGDRLLRGKGGLFGGFLLGALLFRLGIWFIPWVGGFLFVLGLVWGVGAWLVGAWDQRSRNGDSELLPSAMRVAEDELPDDWEFPLPPAPAPEPDAPGRPEATDGEPDPGSGETSEEPPTDQGSPGGFEARMAAIMGDESATSEDRDSAARESRDAVPAPEPGPEQQPDRAPEPQLEPGQAPGRDPEPAPPDDDPEADDWGLPRA